MRTSEVNWRVRLGLACILAIALLTALAPATLAQETSGSITGKITDPSGASVANAAVTAKDVDRGTTYKSQTNSDGAYGLQRLPVGRYELRVEAQGFRTAVREPFDLVLNQVATVDVVLTLGAVSQTVEVSGAAPVLQTQTTEVSTVMESRVIENLPLETRNYSQLALLIPGSVTTSPASFNSGQSTFNSGRPYLNGNREQGDYYLLDGVDNNEFVDNNVAYSPNVDAIQEFNVVTTNPSAEFGQFLGGVISVSIKSGTNSLHGDLFEFIRNDALNANEWSNNFQNLPKQVERWNQFGGTVGGPIMKDKLFFFADYQGSRFDFPASAAPLSTFTAQERTGNLSDIPGIALTYPGTTVPMPANLNQAAICSGGQTMGINPCITGISPTALKIAAALPTPNLPGINGGLSNNLANSQHTDTNGDQGDFKVDWDPSDKDRFMVRYSQQYVINPTTNSQPLAYNSSGNNIFPLQSGVLSYTRTFSPTLLNDFRAGANYFPAEGNVQSLSTQTGANLIPGQPTAYLPALSFSGAYVSGFGTVDAPEIFHQTSIPLSDTVVWTHGTHTMKMGLQFVRYRNDYVPATSNDGAAGTIGFNGAFTGNSEADFFLGLDNNIGYGKGFAGTVGQRNETYGGFVQDDWRLTNRLTLNVGLRWQVFTPIYEVDNRMTNFGEYSGEIELAGVNGNSRALYNQYNGIANFLPRLGLAWTPMNNLVIRTAFSRTSFQEGTGEYNRLATNAPWNIDLVNTSVAGTNGAIPANEITLDQGFAGLGSSGVCTTQTVTSAPASCFAGVTIHMTDPNYRPAISNQWNFTLQRQFGNNTTVQAGYVGEHTDHLAAIYFAGQKLLEPNGTVAPSLYLAGNPALTGDGLGQVRLNTTTGIQNYNALELSVQQRLSRGLSLQANYTWAKCLTNNQGYYGRYGDLAGSQASADVAFQQNVYDVNGDYGYCDHDVKNAFNGYLTYDLPYGHGKQFQPSNKVAEAILGDWQVNTIFTVHSGFPISMLDWSGDPGTGSAQPRPSCISPSIATPFKNYAGGGYIWFDPTTMANPPAGQFGDCATSTERGPGIKQLDLGLHKQFNITERQKLEFRAEAINAFNTPIFTVNGYSIDVVSFPYTPSELTGVVNSSKGARNVQFGLKYIF
jgi:hypothetical protein